MFVHSYLSPYEIRKKHWLRDAIGFMITRIFRIVHEVIPIMVILWFCGVISIDLRILIGVWILYQLLHFIGDIIDHFIEKHDQKVEEEQHRLAAIKQEEEMRNEMLRERESWEDGIDHSFHDLTEEE